jgi:replication-associated recombination protein RarA
MAKDFDYRTAPTSRGYPTDEVVSALQKSIRRSDPAQAAWWAAELDRSAHHTRLWNRLWVILSEDIGPAWLEGPAVIGALHQRWHECKRVGDRRLLVLHAAIAMALAPKSRWVDESYWCTYGASERWFEVPDHAVDRHTTRGRELGRDQDHFLDEGSVLVNEADLGDSPFHEQYLATVSDPEAMKAARDADRLQWRAGSKPKRKPENGRLFEEVDEP